MKKDEKIFYLCGQVSGLAPEVYRANFEKAAQIAQELGAEERNIYNPVAIIEERQAKFERELSYKEIMEICMPLVCNSTDIIIMPNWNYSKGARAEVELANAIEINKHFLKNDYSL